MGVTVMTCVSQSAPSDIILLLPQPFPTPPHPNPTHNSMPSTLWPHACLPSPSGDGDSDGRMMTDDHVTLPPPAKPGSTITTPPDSDLPYPPYRQEG